MAFDQPNLPFHSNQVIHYYPLAWQPKPPTAKNRTKLQVADLQFDQVTLQVKRHGRYIYLRPKELQLLAYFLQNAGRIVTRGMIQRQLWPDMEDLHSNVIETHIKLLRQKIDAPFSHHLLKTVHGFGYKLSSH